VIRAVLDTNVLASGLIKAGGPPGQILEAWVSRRFELILSDHILMELTRTLSKPYFQRIIPPEVALGHIARFRSACEFVTVVHPIEGVAGHAEDDLVLSAAVSAKADYLVTGDKVFHTIDSFSGVRLVSPQTFLEIVQSDHGVQGVIREL
jgi:putative PIN family toxin of toxin-antitoxin system